MKKLWLGILLTYLFSSCGESNEQVTNDSSREIVEYNAKIGIGKFDKLELKDELDLKLSRKGKILQEQKCASCHKLTDEVSIGPGWKDITNKRSPEWLMNLMTNTEEMLKMDPSLIDQVKKYGVSMPDPQLTEEDARSILEFMRSVDAEK
jgi:hypothetical protein